MLHVSPEDLERAAPLLTDRQLAALRGRAAGLSEAEVAGRLGLSRSTVRDHLARAVQIAGLRPAVVPVTTSCARCGGTWSGGVEETRTAFAEHACQPPAR